MRMTVTSMVSLLGLSGAAVAQHAGDVFLSIESGRIVTGLIQGEEADPSIDPPIITSGVRVFGAELGEIAPNFTDEPGFDNALGTFTSASSIGFNIRRAVRKWDGSSFDTIPAETISVGFGPVTPVVSPLADVFTPGFTVPVGSAGEWHRHLEYTLNAPASSGVYLMELELFSTDSAVAASDAFWFVFNQGDSEENHGAAIEWVEVNLVPSPGTGVFAAGAMLLATRRRRRA